MGLNGFYGCQWIPLSSIEFYGCPWVSMGAHGCQHLPTPSFPPQSQALSEQLSPSDLSQGRLYPPLSNIREVSISIAIKVMEFLYANGMAFHYPEPPDKPSYVRSKVWSYEYESFVPDVYDWPHSTVH
ncbi:NAD-dependent malic enzyme, mitochondrial-like [Meleagris gallopavo]|nr:NAD-dependent malic enzyme, mitochondrial-like [Meleagris gallopavo]